MKKTILFLTALAFSLAALSIPALAAEEYENAYGLFSHWESAGYPDDVGGVYSADGGNKLCILLVGRTDEREVEIKSMLRDASTVSFGDSEYSLNDMKKAQDEIVRNYMGKDKPVVGCGVGWTCVDGKVKGFGESGKESRVTVMVLTDNAKETEKLLKKLYGDMVYVEKTDGFVTMEDTTAYATEKEAQKLWPFAAAAFALLAFGSAVFLKRRNHSAAMETSSGEIVTGGKAMTYRQTEKTVAESGKIPSDKVLEKIREEIK